MEKKYAIEGLKEPLWVLDKMHRRHTKKDRYLYGKMWPKPEEWGKQKVTISWTLEIRHDFF